MLGDKAKEGERTKKEKELAGQKPGFIPKKPCAGCPKKEQK